MDAGDTGNTSTPGPTRASAGFTAGESKPSGDPVSTSGESGTSSSSSAADSGSSRQPTLAGAVRVVSGVTLLSRLGGLARDVLVQRLFGDTALGSAFGAGFAIPNLFRRLFGEGALSAAFIPEYTDARKQTRDQADRFSSMVLARLGAATGAITLAIELVLLAVLFLLPHDESRRVSIVIIMLMLPFMPFICMTAILGGMLQVHGKFGAAASGPLVLNGFIIAVGAWHVIRGEAGTAWTAYALAIATTLSGITQTMTFAWILRRDASWRSDWADAAPRVRRMTAKFIPALVGLGALQLNTFMDQVIAMWPIWVGPTLLGFTYPLDEASNAVINAAQRLYQFPLGVFGIAVATAVFPLLSRSFGDSTRFTDTLRRGARLSLFIGLPASAGLLLVNHDLVAVLYGSASGSGDALGAAASSGGGAGSVGAGEASRGALAYSAEGVRRAASVVAGFAPAIWAYSLNHVLTRAFYAAGNTRTPMKISLAVVTLNFVLNLTLIWFIREAGLAWSTSVCAALQCVVLTILCRRNLGIRVFDRTTALGIARVAAATAVMAAGVWVIIESLPDPLRWRDHAVRAAAASVAGVAIYGVASIALRVPEIRWLLRRRSDGA